MPRKDRYGERALTEREQRTIALVAQGLKNCEIARVMGTTEYVVKNYLRVIYDKIGVWNRVELALWYEARQHGSGFDTLVPDAGMKVLVPPRTPGGSNF